MPAIVETREEFPADTTEAEMQGEVDLRMRAGAIRSSYRKDEERNVWILTTQWNVIGDND